MSTQAGPDKEVTLHGGPFDGEVWLVKEGQPAATFRYGEDQRATYILNPVTDDYDYLED